MDWVGHAVREEARYADALARLPDEPDPRQKQLVRAAMAAGGVALARLMRGRNDEAAGWFARSAELYRESWPDAPPESWGRLIGALKSRVLAGDWEGADTDARWALDQGPEASQSPIGHYAAVLALLVLGRDRDASRLGEGLVAEPGFPPPVAGALHALARGAADDYARAVASVLHSFETRDAFLEDIPVADTVIVLEALAERRGLEARPQSALLPAG